MTHFLSQVGFHQDKHSDHMFHEYRIENMASTAYTKFFEDLT